jgi:hypothetical protein
MNTATIVQKLWNYCNVLRDDGMSYGDYPGSGPGQAVEQLTCLLFLKMADEGTRPLILVGPQGIFKPAQIRHYPLSITTTTKGPYKDAFSRQDDFLLYKYRGTDPNFHENRKPRTSFRTPHPKASRSSRTGYRFANCITPATTGCSTAFGRTTRSKFEGTFSRRRMDRY